MDCCEFSRNIAKDPNKKVQMTVREYLEYRNHVPSCDACREIVNNIYVMNPNPFYQSEVN